MKKNTVILIMATFLVDSLHASWLQDVKNFFYKKETGFVSPSPQEIQPALSQEELMQLELRHLNSLGLQDKKGLLEVEIRHLQSKNLGDEIDKLEKEIQEKNKKLTNLKNELIRQKFLQGELRRVLEDLHKAEELKTNLSGLN